MIPSWLPEPRYGDAWKTLSIREENTNMTTIGYGIGFTSCIGMLGLGIALLVTAKNDVAANILGIVSGILGTAWGFIFLGMLMGW